MKRAQSTVVIGGITAAGIVGALWVIVGGKQEVSVARDRQVLALQATQQGGTPVERTLPQSPAQPEWDREERGKTLAGARVPVASPEKNVPRPYEVPEVVRKRLLELGEPEENYWEYQRAADELGTYWNSSPMNNFLIFLYSGPPEETPEQQFNRCILAAVADSSFSSKEDRDIALMEFKRYVEEVRRYAKESEYKYGAAQPLVDDTFAHLADRGRRALAMWKDNDAFEQSIRPGYQNVMESLLGHPINGYEYLTALK